MIPLIFLTSISTTEALFAHIGPYFRKLNMDESQEMARICGTLQFPSSQSPPFITPNFIEHLRTRVAKYPWAVSISLNGKNKLGGALISPYHVLTAAHGFLLYTSYYTKCSARGYKGMSEVKELDVSYGGVCIRGVDRKLPNHPFCTQPDVMRNKIRSVRVDVDFGRQHCNKGHDWAIVELEERVNFTEKVRPICLPYAGMKIGELLQVAGWGRTYVMSDSSPLLHEATMVHAPHCPRPENDFFPSKAPDMLCAVSQNTTDYWAPRTCHGDSGSGMQQRDADGRARLIALTSFGTPGCPADELARFTKIEPYLSEICQETGICYTLPDSTLSNNIPFRGKL
uniref:Peptidase S1 domain-containing protein n=1 Tax=Pristionchus pacificus TaxID=54126 RepID=A0A8R1ZCE2_PRIPA